jgi:hypothetical protein
MERSEAEPCEVIAEVLDTRFMAHRGIWVWGAGVRLGRIFAALAVHLVNLLSSGVVGLQLFIGDRPSGRDAAIMLDFAKILLSQTE